MNKLLVCPACSSQGTKNILGSVNGEGYLIIKRNAYGTTVIYAESYEVSCQCGYGTVISNITNGHASHLTTSPQVV